MKLVKLLSKPISAVAGIVGIPESEKITTKETLLVSDDRYSLLKFNHVKFHLVKDFSEVAVASLGEFDKKKTYVIKDFVKPSEFSSLKPSKYEVGDYLFVYAEGPKHPGPAPVMRKPEPGYIFTPQEWATVKSEFDEKMKKYQEALAKYEEDVKKFIKKEAGLTEYGWLIQVVSTTQYKVIADFSFETTKDERQFGVLGKLPKEVATKVTKALGDLAADDSIKGLTIAEILTKALGLEPELDVVGTIQPEKKANAEGSDVSSS